MKHLFLTAILLLNIAAMAQVEKPKNHHYLGLDVTGLLGVAPNPGIRYQYETKHMQYRAGISYSQRSSQTLSDTFTYITKITEFTPRLGANWIRTHGKFSFYAGVDIFYNHYKTSYNFYYPVLWKHRQFGFQPNIGFRFPLHERFFIQLEGRSYGQITQTRSVATNKGPTNFTFSLFNQYGIILLYRISD